MCEVFVRSDGRCSDSGLYRRDRYLSKPVQAKAMCPTTHATRMAAIPRVYLLGVRRTRPPWSGLRSAKSFARRYSHPVSRNDAIRAVV